jgi:hypothetical protein
MLHEFIFLKEKSFSERNKNFLAILICRLMAQHGFRFFMKLLVLFS